MDPTSTTECYDLNASVSRLRNEVIAAPADAFGILAVVVIALGIFGNLAILAVIVRTKRLQRTPNLFIFALSACDLIVCTTTAIVAPITTLAKAGPIASLLCSILNGLTVFSACFSAWTLAGLCIENYRRVRYPMEKAMSAARVLCMIICIFFLSVAISIPTLLNQSRQPGISFCGKYCTDQENIRSDRLHHAILLLVQFAIPLGIACIAIRLIIRRNDIIIRAPRKGWPDSLSTKLAILPDQQRVSRKRRQLRKWMLIGMVTAFSASWFPLAVFNICHEYDLLPAFAARHEYLLALIARWIALTSMVWNPLLYALMWPEFQRALFGRKAETESPGGEEPTNGALRHLVARSLEAGLAAPSINDRRVRQKSTLLKAAL